MRPSALRTALAAVTTALLLSPLLLSAAGDDMEVRGHGPSAVVPGQYIVMLKDRAASAGKMEKVMKLHGVDKRNQVFDQLKGFAAQLSPEQAAELSQDADIAVVQPDYVVEAYGKPSSSSATTVQTLPTGINRIDADLSPTAKIDGVSQTINVDIAIIDTGVQKTHPDLNVFKQVNFTREKQLDDMNGHGTHVAGIAAAKDNTVGVAGVAPGARIWSVKVLDRNGSGLLSDVIKGIDYVTANALSIESANMSLGCTGCQNLAMDTAIRRSVAAGVVYAVAAGNSAIDAANDSPANHPDVLTVSAIADFNGKAGGGAAATCYPDTDDTFADFSNYGSVVDIAAPGVCILSTYMGSKFAIMSGTSMASPHVAGAAALYLATHAKPTTAAGVAAVRAALIAGGSAQTSSLGFTDDPDGYPEPLVNAAAL